MSDLKLFRFIGDTVEEIHGNCGESEKTVHDLIEKNLEGFLGVRFLAREHGTGRVQRGHIDTLGLDENSCPVIIEYKHRRNENVINQGLYYLNWLMDHKGDFINLVRERLGDDMSGQIEFESSRVICIAPEFSRYDEQAVLQIDRNVELVRYRFFGGDQILLELLNTPLSSFLDESGKMTVLDSGDEHGPVGMPLSMQARIRNMNEETENLYLDLLAFAENLGDDVGIRFLKHYVALSRFRNFTSIQPMKNGLKLWLNLDPGSITLEEGFSRDVRQIGHHASGNLEIDIQSASDLHKACPLIELAYQRN